jgi:hypothetical protein
MTTNRIGALATVDVVFGEHGWPWHAAAVKIRARQHAEFEVMTSHDLSRLTFELQPRSPHARS